MPRFIRFPFMRSRVKVPTQLDPRFSFRVARTVDELAAAYSILHDSYVDMDYMTPHDSGMRILKYYALPTTTTLIALYDDKVVGTISIIRRGSFGLPMEKQFDISASIDPSKVVAEVSSLAIDKKFRARRGELFFPLLKYFWEYTQSFMRLDSIVITVNPRMSDFYEGFLGFKLLKNSKITKYDFANGHPGVGLWYDLAAAPSLMHSYYDRKKDQGNLYKYFLETKLSHFVFPNRDFYKSSDPVMTKDMLYYFFAYKSNVIHKLSKTEKMGLISSYPAGFANFLFKRERNPNPRGKKLRTGLRHSMNIYCQIKNLEKFPIVLLDAGTHGIRISSSVQLAGELQFQIPVAKGVTAKVCGVLRWQDESIYGVRLIETDSHWNTFFKYLQTDYDELTEDFAYKKSTA